MGFETVACTLYYPLFERGERHVSKRNQAVEKVVAGLVGGPKTGPNTTKQAQDMRKTGFFASEQVSEKGTKGFFNTLERF